MTSSLASFCSQCKSTDVSKSWLEDLGEAHTWQSGRWPGRRSLTADKHEASKQQQQKNGKSGGLRDITTPVVNALNKFRQPCHSWLLLEAQEHPDSDNRRLSVSTDWESRYFCRLGLSGDGPWPVLRYAETNAGTAAVQDGEELLF